MPVSRVGTASRSRSTPRSPLAPISTAEHVSPAAPMSWIAMTQPFSMISRQASNSSFSAKGSPTWTVGRFSSDFSSNSAEAIEAPSLPSRPVLTRVVVALQLEDHGLAVADVDHAGILARALDHPGRLGRQALQMKAGGFVRAVLVPHRREDAELGEGRLPPDQLQDALILV